ncbi:MAG: hypothetical protein KIT26_12140 [Nitrosomonas sp.]|nr:hypothetical protein [Nitrosomonas sp.]
MAKERTYRTLDEIEEEYYSNHPDEIDSYLVVAFEEYAKDGCGSPPCLLNTHIARQQKFLRWPRKQELHEMVYKKLYQKMVIPIESIMQL